MTSTSKKQNGTITGQTTGQVTKKSGKGNSHGFVSEVSVLLTVKPGHEEELRAACRRFGEMLRNSDPKDVQKTGVRDARLVVFDDGRRLLFSPLAKVIFLSKSKIVLLLLYLVLIRSCEIILSSFSGLNSALDDDNNRIQWY